MSEIDDLFVRLRSEGRKAFLPFITAGDPDLETTRAVLQLLSDTGCSMGEVGIPYSDPIADGPVIQASYTRALNNKTSLASIFSTIGETKPSLKMPLACMVSYSICLRQGLEQFVDKAIAAGFAGAIVPDLLVEESESFRKICDRQDFSLIQLVTPTTPEDRALRIAEQSTGFLYFVSVTGITGARTELPPGLVDRVAWLKERTELPICIGFGISKPEHVKMLSPVADGVIVGSAIVRIMSDDSLSTDEKIAEIKTFVESLMSAMEPAKV